MELATKSAAYLKAEQMRDQLNAGKTKILAKDLSSVVYLFEDPVWAKAAVKGYIGRSLKPTLNYRLNSEELRAKVVSEWMERVAENTASSKARRKAPARELKVGDVLCASWGYDQTNVDYYKVTSLIGKSMVELVKIAAKSVETTGYMSGNCKPDPDTVIGEPMRKRARGTAVTIDSVRTAFKTDPEKSTYWSSYA